MLVRFNLGAAHESREPLVLLQESTMLVRVNHEGRTFVIEAPDGARVVRTSEDDCLVYHYQGRQEFLLTPFAVLLARDGAKEGPSADQRGAGRFPHERGRAGVIPRPSGHASLAEVVGCQPHLVQCRYPGGGVVIRSDGPVDPAVERVAPIGRAGVALAVELLLPQPAR